ncbi:hypothetical protein AQ477_10765 [Burkholderia thailandensis]|nr:hypothetical protein AQ477_10765 [Burkholderia thailandensis]
MRFAFGGLEGDRGSASSRPHRACSALMEGRFSAYRGAGLSGGRPRAARLIAGESSAECRRA